MSASNPNQDTGALEEHADNKRAQISETLDALEQKISPGQLVDQAASLFKEQGGPMVQNLASTARDNPLPLLLTGVGLAWLMASQSGSSQDDRSHRRSLRQRYLDDNFDDDDDYDDYDDFRDDRYDNTRDVATGASYATGAERHRAATIGAAPSAGTPAIAGDAHDVTSGTATAYRSGYDGSASGDADEQDDDNSEGVMDAVGRKAGDMGDAMRRKRQQARRRAARMQDDGRRRAGQLGDQAGTMARQMQSYFEREPLVAGALGVAVGAIIGSLIPSTDVEDRHLGEASDNVTEQAKSHASSAMQEARQKTEEAGEAIRESADKRVEEDVKPSSSSESATSTSDRREPTEA